MSDFQVHVARWLLPLLLACLSGLCQCKEFSDRELTEPGVIVGIIVGVVGVLVVVGVTLLLCCLFCCKDTACCSCCCCKKDEIFLEAGTVPIKIPSQESPPDNQPISTIFHSGAANGRETQASRRTQDSGTARPPQYDDVPQLSDLWKNKAGDPDRGSGDSLSLAMRSEHAGFQSEEGQIPDLLSDSGAKRSGKTPVRRKLLLGDEESSLRSRYDEESPPHGNMAASDLSDRSKKKHTEAPRHDRAFPAMGLKHRKRHVQSSQEEDEVASVDRNPNEATDAREFPLLEFEPRKRSHVSDVPKTREPAHDGDAREFRSQEWEHEPRSRQPPCPAPRIRKNRNPDGATVGSEFQSAEYGSENRSFNTSYAARAEEFRPVEFDQEPRSMLAYQHQSMQPYEPRSIQPYHPQSIHHEPQSTQSYQPDSSQPYRSQSMFSYQPPSAHSFHSQSAQSYQSQSTRPMCPGYPERQREEEEERSQHYRGPLVSRAAVVVDTGSVSGSVHLPLGRDNQAFNHDSTETTV